MDRTSISSRAARWAADHRRAAILGWIAFVAVAFLIGGAVGTQTIADEDLGNGDSRKAEQIIADAGFPDDDSESVMVQGRNDQAAGDAEFRAAVRDTEQRLAQVAHVTEIQSPLKTKNSGQLSADGSSALIQFELRGTDEQMVERVEAPLAAVAEAQKAHPEFRIEQFGEASADKALDQAEATKGGPTFIVAHTVKGKGVSFMENDPEWHGKAPKPEEAVRAIREVVGTPEPAWAAPVIAELIALGKK